MALRRVAPHAGPPPPRAGDDALAQDLRRLVRGVLHGLMLQAIALQQGGASAEAIRLYEAVLQEDPTHGDAHHNLAVLFAAAGRRADAMAHFAAALDAQPQNWQYWISAVDALLRADCHWLAAQSLEDARRRGLPMELLDAWTPQLVAPGEHVAPADAETGPDAADVLALTMLLNGQRHGELAVRATDLTRQHPGNTLGWRMLGLACTGLNDHAGAAAAWLHLTGLRPLDVDNWNALGLACSSLGRLIEAEAALRTAIARAPDHALAHCNLGHVLCCRGSLQAARAALLRSVDLAPQHAVTCLNLGVVEDAMGNLPEAERWVRQALALHPDFVPARNTLGYLLKDQGRIDEGLESINRALALEPSNIAAHSNRLFLLNYHPDLAAIDIFRAYQDYESRVARPLQVHWRPHPNQRTAQRRLRVGYVSPGFYKHSTRHFLEPLLERHDHARVEVFAYAEMLAAPDAQTARYQACADHWIDTGGLDDVALERRMRDDRIDILVDLAGHTRGNRLTLFARKPAPVSLHWLDFGYSTGLGAIDYYLTDDASVPFDSHHLFAEQAWRLPGPALVYRPNAGMGEAGPLPALANGCVTFGTLTRAIRINHHTVRVWSQILLRVPESRLVVDSTNFRTPEAGDALAARFTAHGVGRERLQIGFHSPPWDLLRSIDIGLDCFPHNSGTTLFEMLFMGVPFVTLASRPAVGRVGSAVLQGLGEPSWIAMTEAEYVDKVVALAADLPALSKVRAGLRQRMQGSALMDEAGFARQVEDAYQQMFARWCARQGAKDEAERPASAPEAIAMENPSLEDLLRRALAQTMQAAVVLHRAGHLQQAQEQYRNILAADPAHADANHNLAVIALACGQPAAAVPLFERAHREQPDNWQYWMSYFDGLLQAHQCAAATLLLETRRRRGMEREVQQELVERIVETRLQQALQVTPPDSAGSAGAARQRRSAATPPARELAQIDEMFRLERMGEVARLARRMTRRYPTHAYGWKALGAALVNLGEFGDALLPLQKAVDLAPANAGALSNLGFALHNQRRSVEAEINLRMALRIQPGFTSAIFNLGSALLGQDRLDEAAALYEQGLAVEPGYIPGHSNLAQVHDEQVRLVAAVAGYRKTLELLAASRLDLKAARFDLTQAHAHQGLCSALAKLADYTEVVAQSDAGLAVLPEDPVLWEKRLYAFSYHPDLPVERIFAEFVRWGDRFPAPVTDFSRHDRTPGRRLRVGYVSPDFRQHTSRFYFLPFFSNHDHAVVETFAYSNVKVEDQYTAQFKTHFDHWRDIRVLSDDEVADLVHADGIDILVDGCNHMRDDRLAVFAQKPAPLQVTWLGAAWTTGLRAVDYVLFDPHIAPPETIAREAIVRLPHCFVPFQSMVQTDLPQPPPCLANGFVTFAYSGRTERLNHHTFRVWGAILDRVPGSVLVLDFRSFADAQNRAHFRALMARCGLDPERVVMCNSKDIFKALHGYDILLDCFPHSGGTMLVDALWMGVPVLTLAARPPLGRIGTSFVTSIGLSQWVAHSEEDYVDKACAFAADTAMLAQLRAGMRERMLTSPLMDGKGFARGVESAYRTMWARYCAGEPSAPITVDAASGEAR